MRASRLYDEYDRSLCDAWKGQPENKLTGIGSGEFGAHAREGDVCTVDGAPGHINAGASVSSITQTGSPDALSLMPMPTARAWRNKLTMPTIAS